MSEHPKPPLNPYYVWTFVLNFNNGPVRVERPNIMSVEDVDDMEQLFALVVRQARRQIAKLDQQAQVTQEPTSAPDLGAKAD